MKKVYFVAGRFNVPGVDEEQVGVWATNSLEPGGGLILAVDGLAKEFTVWPDADTTDAAIDASSLGVEEAKKCLT